MTTQRGARTIGACLLLGASLAACTSGPLRTPAPAPTGTLEGPSMTPVGDDGEATVTVPRLAPPERSDREVSRIVVRDADGVFWDGTSEFGASTTKGHAYRVTGVCLAATAGGALVVDVLGPRTGGAKGGAPSQPMSGNKVATFTVPCDGRQVSLDLHRLPAGSGELMTTEATRQVSVGWVVLSRTA